MVAGGPVPNRGPDALASDAALGRLTHRRDLGPTPLDRG